MVIWQISLQIYVGVLMFTRSIFDSEKGEKPIDEKERIRTKTE